MTKVKARINGRQILEELKITSQNNPLPQLDHPGIKSWAAPVDGTVYGTLLNDQLEVEEMKEKFKEAPYKQPPKAPVLYIKPINTLTGHESEVPLPYDTETLQIGASLGVVIGKQAAKISESEAFSYIDGYTIINDVSIPLDSVFRPAVKEKARDGFCPVGPWIIPKEAVSDPHDLMIKVFINSELQQQFHTGRLVRKIPELLCDVTEYMTLNEGDLLMVGTGINRPFAREGDRIRIEVDEIGSLENTVRRSQQ
ncbi:fumarylacetoacetate hydrolase family protein [Halobacillus sp. Marseille-Q1614]|uniref:fumarylacetoacetate hydrolase family protein n=1 Tax=Halobacillus sp. Marseille-Q1614 TaxID=2709134 RepID=UPI00156F15EC|nr:fumarylacetoacetate hydrolase family protein [Halobacillus sp. Marseille-Q1614]